MHEHDEESYEMGLADGYDRGMFEKKRSLAQQEKRVAQLVKDIEESIHQRPAYDGAELDDIEKILKDFKGEE